MYVLSFLLWFCTGVLKYQIFAKHAMLTQICMFYETKNAQHKYPGQLSKKYYVPKFKYKRLLRIRHLRVTLGLEHGT